MVGLGVVGWLARDKEAELLSPLGRKIGFLTRQNKEEVIGFVPTWMVGKTGDYCEELTQLVFLGIEVEEDGDLVWDVQAKKVYSNEYRNLKNKFRWCGGKNILGIKLFEDKKLEMLFGLNNPSGSMQTEEVTNLIEQVKRR